MPANTLYYFAVGGTGALSVEPLLHLCAAGLGPDRLAVMLIDPDAGNPSLARALQLIDDYQKARTAAGDPQTGFFRTQLIRTSRSECVWTPLATDESGTSGGQTLESYVQKAWMEGPVQDSGDLFDLLFSRQQQIEKLREGFRGNPAIGSIMMHALKDSRAFNELRNAAKGDTEGRFFATGSIFGGTGASALPVIAKLLSDAGIGPERLGGALVTPYYALGVPSKEQQQDGRLKPDSAKFLSAAQAALPTYTRRQTRYRSLYVIGDEQSLPQPRKTYSAGGKDQLNDPHYVELFAALAALDFAGVREPPKQLELRYATIDGDAPGWTDLPLERREELANFAIASNFFLQYFGERRSAAEEEQIEQELQKMPWTQDAGLKPGFVRAQAAELNALGEYFAEVWRYFAATTGNYLPLDLVSFETASTTIIQLPATYASTGKSVPLPRLEGMLRGHTGRQKHGWFRKGDADQLETLASMFHWWNRVKKGDRQGVPGLMRYLAEGTQEFRREWYAPIKPSDQPPNRRVLLHPLKEGLTLVTAGHWERVQTKDNLAEVKTTVAVNRKQRPSITSIPNPWARVQLFRDAIQDPEHPFHEEAVNDILDALELVLFQERLAGVKLVARTVSLDSLLKTARAERREGVIRFVEALQALAPDLPAGGALDSLTLVFNNDRLLFATSPYTLLVTPETRLPSVPGYFTGPRPIRPLAERPPLLAAYIRDVLVKQMAASPLAGMPELADLKSILDKQLPEVPAAALAEAAAQMAAAQREYDARTGAAPANEAPSDATAKKAINPIFEEAKIFPAPGIALYRARLAAATSHLTLAGTRGPSDRYLVLDNSGAAAQQQYFSWLARPQNVVVEKNANREVLPGTSWRFDWISPEHDFLAEKLILLDAPFYPERVRTAAGDGKTPLGTRVVLPLKPKFFEFFGADDVPRTLEIKVSGPQNDPTIRVRLTVPTLGRSRDGSGTVTVEREYNGNARYPAYLSLWPGFKATAPEWGDYYAVLYVDGGDATEALKLSVGARGQLLPIDRVQRDLGAVVHHFREAPEYVVLEAATRTHGDDRIAQGVVLPLLAVAPPSTQMPWTVAIDFGTSNTVAAYRESEQADPKPLAISGATRFDLTNAPATEAHIAAVLDTFFFPHSLDGQPFGTLMFKSLSHDPGARESATPGLTANVPFGGDILLSVGQGFSNAVVGDLKWGGGGDDSARLTRLFLHQILQVVYAEARARGVRTEGIRIRWSYPSAFSVPKLNSTATQWNMLVERFRKDRLGSIEGAQGQAGGQATQGGAAAAGTPTRVLDESTAAMLCLRRDPFAAGKFEAGAHSLKITADVGGGTTDIAGYANNAMVFRSSVLFGGRNIINEADGNGFRPGIFSRVFEWAKALGLPNQPQVVVKAYPSNHTRFTYLVRHPWFNENRGSLASQSWFPAVQTCILYFFGAISYQLGLQLRGRIGDDVWAPDFLFFGGNGSGYLNWLTSFQPWNTAHGREEFASVFSSLVEAGYGSAFKKPLKMFTSSRPKHEVALGLLDWDGSENFAGSKEAVAPVGEDVSVPGEEENDRIARPATSRLLLTELGPTGPSGLRYDHPLNEWQISQFNTAFVGRLAWLAENVDPQWLDISKRVRQACAQLDEQFFDNGVNAAVRQQIKNDNLSALSLFVIEASAVLRELELRLVGG